MNKVAEFWLNKNGEALFPVINFVGVSTARYTPYGAAQRVTWQDWLVAVRQGRHQLQQHVLDAIASTPEQTLANIFNAEEIMDYESVNRTNHQVQDFSYDG